MSMPAPVLLFPNNQAPLAPSIVDSMGRTIPPAAEGQRPVQSKNTRGAISIRNVTKIYDPEGVNVMAVDNCSMEIAPGEVCMIVGPSGCGKTRC